MPELPLPEAFELPQGSVIAVPAQGIVVYRLVRGASVTEADFVSLSLARARLRHVPELLRVGLSHYLTAEEARAVMRRVGSRVAAVSLNADLNARIARTGRAPGHVTVRASVADLVRRARVVA